MITILSVGNLVLSRNDRHSNIQRTFSQLFFKSIFRTIYAIIEKTAETDLVGSIRIGLVLSRGNVHGRRTGSKGYRRDHRSGSPRPRSCRRGRCVKMYSLYENNSGVLLRRSNAVACSGFRRPRYTINWRLPPITPFVLLPISCCRTRFSI